jgi:hypothetical protein
MPVTTTKHVVKDVYVNLPGDGSSVSLYIHPATPNLAVALNKWQSPIYYLTISNGRFIEAKLTMLQHSTRESDEGTPCKADPGYSFYKCVQNLVSREFLSFPKTDCPNVTAVCWIPQVQGWQNESYKVRSLQKQNKKTFC